jgi:hypothetical protein
MRKPRMQRPNKCAYCRKLPNKAFRSDSDNDCGVHAGLTGVAVVLSFSNNLGARPAPASAETGSFKFDCSGHRGF